MPEDRLLSWERHLSSVGLSNNITGTVSSDKSYNLLHYLLRCLKADVESEERLTFDLKRFNTPIEADGKNNQRKNKSALRIRERQ